MTAHRRRSSACWTLLAASALAAAVLVSPAAHACGGYGPDLPEGGLPVLAAAMEHAPQDVRVVTYTGYKRDGDRASIWLQERSISDVEDRRWRKVRLVRAGERWVVDSDADQA